jgi:hypothetical protein
MLRNIWEEDADIEIFEALRQIADRHNLKQTPWARASWPDRKDNPQSRISELKRIVNTMKEKGVSQEEASIIVKRRCTWEKVFALSGGMMKELGERLTRKELLEIRKSLKSKDARMIFDWLILDENGKESLLRVSDAIVDATVPKS